LQDVVYYMEAAFMGLLESWSCSAFHLLWAHTPWSAIQLTETSPKQGFPHTNVTYLIHGLFIATCQSSAHVGFALCLGLSF